MYPGTVASEWVLLHAANEYYNTAMGDLPNNRDVAVSNLRKALDLFTISRKEAPKDSFQARAALIGKARCLEARNELAKAIEQYELVAKNWPDSPEAEQAKKLAEALKKAGGRRVLQRALCVFPAQGHVAAAGQREAQFPGPARRISHRLGTIQPARDPRPGGSDSSRHQRNQARAGTDCPRTSSRPRKKAESEERPK